MIALSEEYIHLSLTYYKLSKENKTICNIKPLLKLNAAYIK